MKKMLIIMLPLLFVSGSNALHAATETFIQEYTYTVGEQDSRFYSRIAATNQLRSLLAQTVGKYVYAALWEGWDNDYREKMTVITGDIMEMKILEEDGENWNGKSYHMKAQVTIDSEDVKQHIAGVLQQEEEKARAEEEATLRILAARNSDGFETRERDYTYRATRNDNEMTAKINATELLRFDFLQEIGVYMQSKQTLTQGKEEADYQEKTEAIMAAIIQLVPIKTEWDKKTYYLKAKMTFNPDDVKKRVDDYLQNDVLTQELVKSRNRVLAAQAERDSLNAKYERLEKDYNLSQKDKERQIRQIQNAYQQAVEQLSVEDAFRQDCLAAEFKNKGIDSNSQDGLTYYVYNYGMGIDYYNLGRYEKSIDYYQRAIDINPTESYPYYAMGFTYEKIGKSEQATNYYQKAAQLNHTGAQKKLKEKGYTW